MVGDASTHERRYPWATGGSELVAPVLTFVGTGASQACSPFGSANDGGLEMVSLRQDIPMQLHAMEMEKLDEDSGRWSGAIPVLPVAILAGALLSGCASMIYETPNGGVRTVVSPLVNQHLIVITNESRVTAKISVNGNPACLLAPGELCTPRVTTSRLSGGNPRAEFVISAVGQASDGTVMTFSRKVSVYSYGSYNAETRASAVRVRLRPIR